MAEKCAHCGRGLQKHCGRGCARCTAGYTCPTHGKDWARKTGGGLFSSGFSGSGAKCRKCGRSTVNCRWCRGQRGKTCNTCGGTGQTCASHGRYWT